VERKATRSTCTLRSPRRSEGIGMEKQTVLTFQTPQKVLETFGRGTAMGDLCAELVTLEKWPSGRRKVRKPRKGAGK
jgi:hypothetical protein